MAPQKRPRWETHRLAELVNRALDPLIAKQGFGETTLLTQWETIVGARLAAICEPARLNWPPRPKKPAAGTPAQAATLMLRVEPGFGLDVQHMSGSLIDRINAHLGWRCIARVAIRQEPLRHATPRRRREPLPRNPGLKARAEAATEGIADEALRRALATLGERAFAQSRED
ncbi:MAG: DciA family protein [Methylocystis sp.]